MEAAGSAILLLNISMTHEYIVWGCGHGQNATAILLLMVAMACMGVPVTAQVPSPSIPPESPSPPVTCNFANTSTISSNWCNYNEQSSTESLTLGCKSFLTNSSVPAPSTECCQGFNSIANKSTACICMATFYPPATHNMTRQLELPRLCGLKTDLCGQCPTFLVSRSNATASPYTADAPNSAGRSVASTVGAISLAVVFGLLLVGGIITMIIVFIKKRRAKKNPPGIFEAPPPGGAF